jgi:hypothetical protein
MAKHKVNWHLHMGKTEHHAGDEIEMGAESAAPLIGMGVLTPMATEESAPVEDMSPSQIAKANKEQLAQYAKQRYGVDLNSTEMTKDAMLAAIAEAQAKGGE